MKAPLFLAVTCEGLPTNKVYATMIDVVVSSSS